MAESSDSSEVDALWAIITAPGLLQEHFRRTHGRMTDVVSFELPMTHDTIGNLLASEGADPQPSLELAATAVADDVRSVVAAEAPEGADPHYFQADSGRGASGYAVALELAGYVADIGGAGSVLWASALGVRRMYRRLVEVLGRPPLISMGTAVYLAAADLSERLGSTDFTLHGRGDARSDSPDHSFSGDDVFYVIFERSRVLYSYLVDARGRVHFQGTLEMRDVFDEPPPADS